MDIIRSLFENPLQFYGLAAALGVASHHVYFIRGEHHMQVVRLAQITSVAPIVIGLAFLWFHAGLSIFQAAANALSLEGSFLAGLWTSILIYRAFFHRLRSFPGPNTLKLSKFAHAARLGDLDNYKVLDRWHEKYGDFVRTGPSELTIVAPEALEAIQGSRSLCTKGPWYDSTHPLLTMHQARDRASHDKRRRVWDRGFSVKALDGYQPRVKYFADSLTSQISSFGGAPVNASRWFNYYSFDVMGELAFGKSFDMLKTGEKHFALELLSGGQKPLGMLGCMPWLLRIMVRIPVLNSDYKKWIAYCEEQVENRKLLKVDHPDIMSWLLEGEKMSTSEFENQMWLVGDARLIIVAGSDTTAATLTHMFYHFARDPTLVERLRKELEGLQRDDGTYDVKELAKVDVLNGIINETLRLHPPVPSGVYRQTPPEGIMIGDRKIPGDITVSVPAWTLGRSPKAYEKPLEFIPERWYSEPELILNKAAFAPFSGAYGCIGKNLALMELRTVTADLVTKFDVSFAPREDGWKLLNKSEDYFSIGLADLILRFTERKK